jgi:large subunit ribosomal protein L18
MNTTSVKKAKRDQRHARGRAKISGTNKRPRIAVFKSNVSVYVQVIDDEAGKTLIGLNDSKLAKGDVKATEGGNKEKRAFTVGQKLAEHMKKLGIEEAIFDKGGFKYHGRVKAVAEGLRQSGIKI